MSSVLLKIRDNRALLTGRLDNITLQLSMRLEGRKDFLKTGGFSFEPTPFNMEHFRALYPDAVIEGAVPGSKLFENWADATTAVGRGQYAFRTPPFPFQGVALARSSGLKPQIWPTAVGREPDACPAEATGYPCTHWAPPGIGHNGPPPDEPSVEPPAKVFAILGETGTGKTKILIDTAGLLWSMGLIDAVLVVSPKGVHAQWIEEQLPEHLNVPWQGAIIDTQRKVPRWDRSKLCIMSVNADYPRLKHGVVNCEEFIDSFRGRVLMIVDESHKIKTFSSARTEAIIELGRACAYRRIATGTPLSLNLMDAFAQYYFLDEAILGQRYVSTFKAEYCITQGSGKDEVITGHKNVEQFWSRVDKYTFRITKDEADLGLPPKHYDRVQFELSAEQKHHYETMKADMLANMDSGQLIAPTSIMTQMLRLQQIACGFLTDGDKLQYLDNARMQALMDTIEQREGKIVIWARFKEDIKAIKKALGAEAVTYYGETSDADRKIAKEKFLDHNSGIRFFVSNPAAGGTGLNLQGDCRTVIYYSNSFNAIDRWQSEDRVHRIGTRSAVTYFDLVARGTIDLKLLRNLRNKKSISDLAFDDIRQMLMAA